MRPVSRLIRTLVVLTCSVPATALLAQGQNPVVIAPRPAAPSPPDPARTQPQPAPAKPLARASAEDKSLVVDQSIRSYRAEPGQLELTIPIQVYNAGVEPAVITDVQTSCGCSVPKLPSKPWTLAPLQHGEFTIVIDLRGKSGNLVKTATIETKKGNRVVTMQIMVPPPTVVSIDRESRERNMQLASGDRQAVFKGDCVRCHVTPLAGLVGEALYKTGCGICHEAEHRASMVPDLRNVATTVSRDYWRAMIVAGKPGTLMPGFSNDMGGPLNKTQIDSLVDYLATAFVPNPSAAKTPAPAASSGR